MIGAAADWFRGFHGRAPREVAEAYAPPAWLADLGPLVSVSYLRETPSGPELRSHTFTPEAAPVLARTDSGSLTVVGGRYTTGRRGIMDNRGLARRDGSSGSTSMMPRVTPQGVPVHGRAIPREGLMVPRANPLELVDLREGGGRVASACVAGGTCLTAVGLSDMVVERTTWTEGSRAWAQGLGLGVPGALLCFTAARDVGAGLVVAGFTGAGLRVARSRQWDRTVAGWINRLLPNPAPSGADAGALLWGEDGGADVRVEATANG